MDEYLFLLAILYDYEALFAFLIGEGELFCQRLYQVIFVDFCNYTVNSFKFKGRRM